MSRVVRARFEKGVLKLLDKVDLEEGREYRIIIEDDVDKLIKKYRGCLGKSSIEEFEELIEEAQAQ